MSVCTPKGAGDMCDGIWSIYRHTDEKVHSLSVVVTQRCVHGLMGVCSPVKAFLCEELRW